MLQMYFCTTLLIPIVNHIPFNGIVVFSKGFAFPCAFIIKDFLLNKTFMYNRFYHMQEKWRVISIYSFSISTNKQNVNL